MPLAYIPAPPGSVLHLGPIPVRAYALCIIAGVAVAVYVANRRYLARGGPRGAVADVATWAVPFGLVGARIYHVATDPELYFGKGRDWVDAFAIWHGGLGIWGAIALGALGAWIACRRRGLLFAPLADAAAPGIALAQAVGRWGNYFNQELYGGPTHLPWALFVDPGHRPANTPDVALYQPTFLYESLWDIGVAALVVWADRRFRLGHGRAFAVYVAAYTAGRGWIEALRVDHANHFLGLRLNDWTSLLVFTAACLFLLLRRGGREHTVFRRPVAAAAGGAAQGSATTAADGADRAAADAAGSRAGAARGHPPDRARAAAPVAGEPPGPAGPTLQP